MTSLRIRGATPADSTILAALNNYGLRAAGINPNDDIYAGEVMNETTQPHQPDVSGCLLVGEVAGQVVAMGGLRRIDQTTCELLRMRVAPEHQGNGYATELLRTLEETASKLGFRRITLITGENQHPAIDLYTRHDYKVTEHVVLIDIASVRMEKQIAS